MDRDRILLTRGPQTTALRTKLAMLHGWHSWGADFQRRRGGSTHVPAPPREGAARGFMLYPGKLTTVETFRVGCIGAIGALEMQQAVNAVGEALREMGIPTPPAA